MAEAERRLSSSLTPRQCTAVMVLARQAAIKAVKQQLQREGLRKATLMSRRELTVLAKDLSLLKNEFGMGTGRRMIMAAENESCADLDIGHLRPCKMH